MARSRRFFRRSLLGLIGDAYILLTSLLVVVAYAALETGATAQAVISAGAGVLTALIGMLFGSFVAGRKRRTRERAKLAAQREAQMRAWFRFRGAQDQIDEWKVG